MITWADFTLKRIEKNNSGNWSLAEESDWRKINTRIHPRKKGLAEFKAIQQKTIRLLKKKLISGSIITGF